MPQEGYPSGSTGVLVRTRVHLLDAGVRLAKGPRTKPASGRAFVGLGHHPLSGVVLYNIIIYLTVLGEESRNFDDDRRRSAQGTRRIPWGDSDGADQEKEHLVDQERPD